MSSLPEQSLWGVFGGSFDPPHNGHLALVQDLIAKTPLEGVSVVPTWKHPFKNNVAVAPYEDRLAMARLAFADSANVAVSDIEMRRNLSGYTLDTLLALKQELPSLDLAFIVGADLLTQFRTWHRPDDILREAILVVGQRPGYHLLIPPDFPVESLRMVETPLLDVSSSDVRNRIRKSGLEAVKEMVPPQVCKYISDHRLYL
jgi:nicotinate-nucleotide adenylyltransferase